MSLALPRLLPHNLLNSKRERTFLARSRPTHPSLPPDTHLADLVLIALALTTFPVTQRAQDGDSRLQIVGLQSSASNKATQSSTAAQAKKVSTSTHPGSRPSSPPGVSCALAAPTFANIPVTQRGSAESARSEGGVLVTSTLSDIAQALESRYQGRETRKSHEDSISSLLQTTHTALTRLVDLVLSNKLVPDAVLGLIPKSTKIEFSVENRAAQSRTAVQAKKVSYFCARGLQSLVIPGVFSSLTV
ncbi:hypothetical protein DFP72DRAFT_1090488 [Ephemerocybe angulata]|uniref:Uncharacterized protein n=1 Tax=Ephemerocybe angulata TaxID=980116 RepID=A0A8H6M9Y7_9AGAR|nr:hypothetical protein DFP72DRAFT_1090488 [Tulosesus angulatus]